MNWGVTRLVERSSVRMNTMLGWTGRAVAVVSTGASTTRNGKSAMITKQFHARLFITTSTGAILQRENSSLDVAWLLGPPASANYPYGTQTPCGARG